MEPHLTSDMFLPPPVTRYRQQCEIAAQEEEAHMVLDFAERLNYNLGKVCDGVSAVLSDCLGRAWCVPAPVLLPCLGEVGARLQSSADVPWGGYMVDASHCVNAIGQTTMCATAVLLMCLGRGVWTQTV